MLNEMMAREIAAQPQVMADCSGPLSARIASLAVPERRIFAGGCGDSAFAPKALGGVFAALGLDIEPKTSMELASFTRFNPGDSVILTSISGGTKRTVEAAQAAGRTGARVIALTCNGDSALAHAADETIVLPFTPLSRKTPHTLDYSVTLLALVQLALHWSGRQSSAVTASLGTVPALLAAAKQEAKTIAATINPGAKFVFLGAGPDLGTAEYGAAKFHEAGGLVAIAAETENFIHGMNFVVEPEDVLLALAGSTAGKRRGAQITTAFSDYFACAHLLGHDHNGTWEEAWQTTLSLTFALQYLCLEFAEKLALPLEQPRAGRRNGDIHIAIQSSIMAQ